MAKQSVGKVEKKAGTREPGRTPADPTAAGDTSPRKKRGRPPAAPVPAEDEAPSGKPGSASAEPAPEEHPAPRKKRGRAPVEPAPEEQEAPRMEPAPPLAEPAPEEQEAPRRRPGRPPLPRAPYDGPALGFDDATLQHVPLKAIDLEDETFQIRFSSKPDASLLDSVRSVGVQIPVIVRTHPKRRGSYQVVCGFRRSNAAKLAGLETVPVQIRELDDEQAQVMAWTENEFRKTLRDLDRALAIEKMHGSGRSLEAVASIFRLSKRQVQRLKRLLDYPHELKAALDDESSGITTSSALILWQARRKHGQAFHLGEWIRKAGDLGSIEELKKAIRHAFKQKRTRSKLVRSSKGIVSFNIKAARAAKDEEKEAAIRDVEGLLADLETVLAELRG